MHQQARNSSIHLLKTFFGLAVLLTALSPQVFAAKSPAELKRIEGVGDDFEGLMMQQLYAQMKQSNQIVNAGDDNPFAPSHAEVVFRAMLDEVVMKQIAKRRSLGVGDMVERQLKGEGGVPSRKSGAQGRNLLKSTGTPGG